jgi:fructose/tagatose bisphosphate aldolase
MKNELQKYFTTLVNESIKFEGEQVKVVDAEKLRRLVYKLAETSALEKGEKQGLARFVVRAAALDLGIFPASINELYLARGRGEVPCTFTVPALNLRVLSFNAARAAFRALQKVNGGAVIFEIARSEMNYTDQRPAEYSTSILAAAIAEGYKGPVFIQGDHFQVSAKKYAVDAKTEIEALEALICEAIDAGFFNIDVDTSTLVDLSKTTINEQQRENVLVSAKLTKYIRYLQPEGVEISIGGEIGEVGGHNSTIEEMEAYLGGFQKELNQFAPHIKGLSKISIQTGTSHGGVVLPDGSIAKVNVDFDTLKNLSRVGRSKYGMGGTVQHGASTLPEDAFGKFPEYEACEVHLATNFMNMFFELAPKPLVEEMYAYLREKQASERKADMTDEQFYYKTRKNVIGLFKEKSWKLPAEEQLKLGKAWEEQFIRLFTQLGLKDTKKYVEKEIKFAPVYPKAQFYLGKESGAEDVKDLAD